jgi:hypothetical protein
MNNDVLLMTQLSIGFVFILATFGKLRDLPGFLAGMREYKAIPKFLLYPSGIAIISAETAIAFSHLSGRLLPAMFFVTIGLLIVFLVVVLLALRSGVAVACLCFGTRGRETVSVLTALRIVILLVAEALLAYVSISVGSWKMPYELPIGEVFLSGLASALALAVLSSLSTLPVVAELWASCASCNRRRSADSASSA